MRQHARQITMEMQVWLPYKSLAGASYINMPAPHLPLSERWTQSSNSESPKEGLWLARQVRFGQVH
jgi:hypothetical protein